LYGLITVSVCLYHVAPTWLSATCFKNV
jgi:hypothetical protein